MRARHLVWPIAFAVVTIALVVAGAGFLVYVVGTTEEEALDELAVVRRGHLRVPEGYGANPDRTELEGRSFCIADLDCGRVSLETTYSPWMGTPPLACEGLPALVREGDFEPADAPEGSCAIGGVIPNGSGYVHPVRWTMTLDADARLHVRLEGRVIVP